MDLYRSNQSDHSLIPPIPVQQKRNRGYFTRIGFGILLGLCAHHVDVNALPEFDHLSHGQASIQSAQQGVWVNQTTDMAILNWKSLNVGVNEQLNIQQPSSNSHSLHRVIGQQDFTRIEGQLISNGQITLVAPNGLYLGPKSLVDVAGFIASTAQISDQNFINGNGHFKQAPENKSMISSLGTIKVADEGLIALMAPAVRHTGIIQARLGKVVLAAGTEFTVGLQGNQMIQFTVEGEVKDKILDENKNIVKEAISHMGHISAEGGQVILTAKVAKDVVDRAIYVGGVIEAKSLQKRNGRIILAGGESGIVEIKGKQNVSGLNVSGLNSGEKGGDIQITGEKIHLNGAELDARGFNGGGSVKIGGEREGRGILPHATWTWMTADSVIYADATNTGNGGEVILFAKEKAGIYGNIYARGGVLGGDGGFIEYSGKQYLDVAGDGRAEARYSTGKPGLCLFDPADVNIIQAGANTNGAFSGGNPDTWNPSASPSTLLTSSILTRLNAGTSVTVTTSGAAGGNGDITFVSPANVTTGAGAAGTTFTLLADRNITIAGGTTVNTTGNVNFHAGTTVATGTFTHSGTFTVSGTTQITAPGGITFNNAVNLTGAVTLNTSGNNGNMLFSNTITSTGAWNLTAGTGNITFNTGAAGTTVGSLTVVSANQVTFDRNLTTTGVISIPSPIPVFLTRNLTFNANTAAISIGGTVNSSGANRTFTLNTSGNVTLSSALGGTLALGTFAVNGGGTAFLAGNITTNNAAVSFSGPVLLNADIAIASGNGAMTFSNTLNSNGTARNLTLTTTGATTFTGAVGGVTPLASLTKAGTGSTTVNNNVTTNGAGGLSFGGNLVLATNPIALTTSAGNGPITVTGTTNGAQTLTLTAGTGNIIFGNTIGATTALTGLSLVSAGQATFTGNVTLNNSPLTIAVPIPVILNANTNFNTGTGNISLGGNINGTNRTCTFTGPVLLNANVAIATGTGSITFNNTLNSNGASRSLSLTTTGTTTMTGVVGGILALSSLSKLGTGSTTVHNNITTDGAGGIGFGGNLVLATNPIAFNTSAGNGPIAVTGTTNGAETLSLTAGTGTISFGAAIGNTTALTGFSVVSASQVNLTGNLSTTNAPITIPSPIPVTINANTTFSSGTGNLILGGTVVSGGGVNRNLTINNTGVSTLGTLGSGGGTNALGTFTTNALGTTHLTGNITTTGVVTFNDAVLLDQNVLITSGASNVTFNTTIDSNAISRSLSVNTTGTTLFFATIGGTTPLSSLSKLGTGTTNVRNNITTDGASGISFAGALLLQTNNVAFNTSAGNGPITVSGTTNGARPLSLTAGTGVISFGAAIGNTTPLTGFSVVSASQVNLTGNLSTTNALISIPSPIPVSLNANSVFSAGTGAITLDGTVVSAGGLNRNLTINNTGVTTLGTLGSGGGTNALGALLTNAGGSTHLTGNITTTGTVTFNDAVLLDQDVVISSGASAVSFNNTLNSNAVSRSLTVNTTGNTTFTGIVGGVTPLASLSKTGTGASSIANDITTNGAGGINFGGAVNLTNNIMLNTSAGNGPLSVSGAINGAHTLNIVLGNGSASLLGGVGTITPLTSITFTSASSIQLAGNFTTTNTWAFPNGMPVTLSNSTGITSNTGSITFADTLNGSFPFTLSAPNGDITFSDLVGNLARIGTFTVSDVQNFISAVTLKVASFNQVTGSNTTDFGTTTGLNSLGSVNINTQFILGNIVGGATYLNGVQNIQTTVQVFSLTLNGMTGGTVVGTVAGFSDELAAYFTALAPGATGVFTMNGFVLPLKRQTPVITTAPPPIVETIELLSGISSFNAPFLKPVFLPSVSPFIIPGIAIPNIVFPSTIYFRDISQEFWNTEIEIYRKYRKRRHKGAEAALEIL